MSLSFEEVELIARLEIDTNLESLELSNLVNHMNSLTTFDVAEQIRNYFLEGVRYGLEVDEETTTLEVEIELMNIHSNLVFSESSEEIIEDSFHTPFRKLFSVIFINGTQWSIQHKILNEKL